MGANYFLIGDYDQLYSFLLILHGKTEELFALHFYTNRQVMDLKEEWFGNEAEAFFEIMEDHLLPYLWKVIEAMYATQDRIKEVMRTIHRADEDTRIYFSTDALTSDDFNSLFFLETLSPAAKQAGLVSMVGGAGAAAAVAGTTGTNTSGGSATTTDKSTDSNKQKGKEHHGSAPVQSARHEHGKRAGKVRAHHSGEMSGLSEMGSSLNGKTDSSSQVGSGGAQAGNLESGMAGSGGGSGSSSGAGSAGNGSGSGTPTPDIGLASGAGLGAGAASAAAIAAAARVVKEDQPDE